MYQNPFLSTLVIPYIRVIRRDTPAGKSELNKGDYYDLEKIRSTRVYRLEANYERLKDLSVTGYRLFMWILFHLPNNSDSIVLDDKTLAEKFDCSERTILRARLELIQHTILAKRRNNEYWTNPHIFASEGRLSLYEGHTTCVATVREQPKQSLYENLQS